MGRGIELRLGVKACVNSEKPVLNFSNIFVANPLSVPVALVTGMDCGKVRLQNRDKLPGGFLCLRELHGVMRAEWGSACKGKPAGEGQEFETSVAAGPPKKVFKDQIPRTASRLRCRSAERIRPLRSRGGRGV